MDSSYKLHKLMENSFKFRIIGRKPKNIQPITRLGLCKRGGGDICADQHAFYFHFWKKIE